VRAWNTSVWSCPFVWWTDAQCLGRGQQFGSREETDEGKVGIFLNPGLTAGLPVYQGKDGQKLRAVIPEGVDGPQNGSATGHGILDDNHRGAAGQSTLDLVSGSMGLRALSHREGIDRRSLDPTPMGQSIGDRVSTHGEAPDPFRCHSGVTDGGQTQLTHQCLAFSAHGGSTGIDVVGRTSTAGQGKVTQDQRSFDEEFQEAVALAHTEELRSRTGAVKAQCREAQVNRPALRLGWLALLLLGLAGCDGDSVALPDPRFGQIGQLQVQVQSPVADGVGMLEETLVWRSDGPWVLAERISYGQGIGGETVRRPVLNPGDLATEYRSLVQQVNESPGLRLFAGDVPQGLEPECESSQSRVVLTIRDDFRDEDARWSRCADGGFFTATPGGAGPDPGASRVVTTAQLARFFTLGETAISSYLGTVPFRTLDRGGDSPARPVGPRSFRSGDGETPGDWEHFWASHGGGGSPPPVDWNHEMVILAAVGRQSEAGDSVQVRRILPIDEGTRVELVRRVPGDFCSPAAQEGYPYHLVVAPRTAAPIQFAEPLVERIPCGL
jgi:hypothetical protein